MFLGGWALVICPIVIPTHIRCIELNVVESVDEVGPELQAEPLSELKILMQTHVYVGEMRRTQSSELRCAIAKSSKCRVGEVSVVGEPLNARLPGS